MKVKFFLLTPLVLSAYLFNSCDDSGTDSPEGGDPVANQSHFPSANGNYYKYNINRTNSDGSQTTGTRSTSYSGTINIGGTDYQIQIDSLVVAAQVETIDSMYFRKSETGVFFYLDTTGLSASTPDLIPYLPFLSIDNEIRLLLLPIFDNSTWPAFQMSITTQGITFNPVVVSSAYDGQETLTLNLSSGSRNVDAVRIKYTLTITIPGSSVQTYNAFGWIAEDIGFVKWEGNAVIIGAFTGNGIDFVDTSSVINQSLIEYDTE